MGYRGSNKSKLMIETKFGIFYILTFFKRNIVMDDENLDEKSLGK